LLLNYARNPRMWIKENRELYSTLNKFTRQAKRAFETTEAYAQFLSAYERDYLESELFVKRISENLEFGYKSPKQARLFERLAGEYKKLVEGGIPKKEAVKEILSYAYRPKTKQYYDAPETYVDDMRAFFKKLDAYSCEAEIKRKARAENKSQQSLTYEEVLTGIEFPLLFKENKENNSVMRALYSICKFLGINLGLDK